MGACTDEGDLYWSFLEYTLKRVDGCFFFKKKGCSRCQSVVVLEGGRGVR